MNKAAVTRIGDGQIRREITEVYESWDADHLSRRKDGKINRAGLKKRIAAAQAKGVTV